MKLNPLLVGAAIVYSAAGLPLIFAPAEILTLFGTSPSSGGAWMAQLLGAAIVSLAFLDWLQRYAEVGGILGRPVLIANLAFTTIAFFASLSAYRHQAAPGFLASAAVLGVLMLAFGVRLFGRARNATRGSEGGGDAGVTRR